MGNKSSIAKLPPEIKEACDKAIREGRATIDQIVAMLQGMGADVSRTAVGDYKKKMETSWARVREAQEVGSVWAAKLGENPDSPMGQLVAEVIKSVAFRTLTDLDASGATVEPEDLMLLARALQSVGAAQKVDHEFRRKLRAEYMEEMKTRATVAADQVTKITRSAGLSAEAAASIREQILGIPS